MRQVHGMKGAGWLDSLDGNGGASGAEKPDPEDRMEKKRKEQVGFF